MTKCIGLDNRCACNACQGVRLNQFRNLNRAASGIRIVTANDRLLSINDLAKYLGGPEEGAILSVTGELVNNIDPQNPVVITPDADDIDDFDTSNKFVTSEDLEKINQINLLKNPVFSYTGDLLTRIDYEGGLFKILSYANDILQTLVFFNGTSTITKTFNYTGDRLTSITQTEA